MASATTISFSEGSNCAHEEVKRPPRPQQAPKTLLGASTDLYANALLGSSFESTSSSSSSSSSQLAPAPPLVQHHEIQEPPVDNKVDQAKQAGLAAFQKFLRSARERARDPPPFSDDMAPITEKMEVEMAKQHARFMQEENKAREGNYWPEKSFLLTPLTFVHAKLSVPFQSNQDAKTARRPACAQCDYTFWLTNSSNTFEKHWKSAMHMKRQLAVDNKQPALDDRALRFTDRIHHQSIVKLKATAFSADAPQLSFKVGAKVVEFGSRMFEPVGPLLQQALVEARKANVTNLVPSLVAAAAVFASISETALDEHILKKGYNDRAAFEHDVAMEDMRDAITPVSSASDACTSSATNRTQELLMGSAFDKDWNYRLQYIGTIDVSEKGASTGKAIHDKQTDLLAKNGLDIDHKCTDGASNACADTGHTKSSSALFLAARTAENLPASSDWCKAHILNLINGDMIKLLDYLCPGVIQLIRQTKSFLTRSSAHTAELAKLLQKSRLDLKELVKACDHLERHVKDTPPPFTNEEVEEIQRLQTQLREKKITLDKFKDEMKQLGRRSALAGYLVVRWYSLFNSATALVQMSPFLEKLFEKIIKESVPKKTSAAPEAGQSGAAVPAKKGAAVPAKKGGDAVEANEGGAAVEAKKGGAAVPAKKRGAAVQAKKGGVAVEAKSDVEPEDEVWGKSTDTMGKGSHTTDQS